MKKLFSTCLMAMAMATMSAQDVPFTVSPASGSIVESITSENPIILELPSDSNFSTLLINTKDDIYFTYNGEKYCGILATGYDLPLEIKPEVNLTKPGEYQLVIKEGAIGWQAADIQSEDDFGDNTEDLVYTYTIEGEASEGLSFNVSPDPSVPLTSALKYVYVTIPAGSDYAFTSLNDASAIYVNKDGERHCTTNPELLGDDTLCIFLMGDGIKAQGNYELIINAGAISINGEPTTEAYTFNYTYEGSDNLPIILNPSTTEEVESLNVIEIYPNWEDGYYEFMIGCDEDQLSNYIMLFDENGDPIESTIVLDDYCITMTLTDAVTTAGTYTLMINENTIACISDDDMYVIEDTLSFEYNVTGVTQLDPVEYDVIPTDYSPSADSVIDYNSRDLATIIIYTAKDIAPAENATAYLIPVDDPEDVEEAPIKKNRVAGQLIIDFDAREYSGEYTLLIPEGSFGDEVWIANPEYGHANPEISVTYTLINAKDRAASVEYTLVPEVTASNDYKTFTLKFDEKVNMVQYANAFLECVEARYSKFALFTDNGDNTFTAEFSETPQEAGTYTFIVEQGLFGNEEFAESNGFAGVANQAITLQYEVTTTGIENVAVDEAKAGVYNLMGVKVAETTDNLPAGIYIVNGKKVVVK